MSYKFLILYLGRKHRSPAGKGLAKNPFSRAKRPSRWAILRGKNHSIPVHLGCKCFLFGQVSLNPHLWKILCQCCQIAAANRCAIRGPWNSVKNSKSQKKTRIFGDLVIEITSKSQDMVIICDNYSYPKI